MTAGIAAARIIRTDKGIVNELRLAGAYSAPNAHHMVAAGLRGRRMRRLTGAGALVSVGEDRYYLDEAGWNAFQVARRRRMLFALVGVLAIFAILAIIGFIKF